MESNHREEQLYQAADHLLDVLWLRQTEALDFFNDVSLLLYAMIGGRQEFAEVTEYFEYRIILERILKECAELKQLDYPFGGGLRTINDDVRHELTECLHLVSLKGQPKESAVLLFDYLLQQMYAKEKIGIFLTPQTLADMMARMLDPQPGQVVLDPVCGSGRLLIAAADRCRECSCIGIDIDERIRTTAFFNMAFHKVDHGKLYGKDFLREPWREQGDVILANPPYSDDIRETVDFIERILDALKPGGKCGILVPEGFLTNVVNRNVVAMRRSLLCSHSLEGVISLPRKLYKPYTVSKSSLVLLRKQPALPGEKVCFCCVPEYDGAESEFSDAVYQQDMRRISEAWKHRKQRQDIFWTASSEEIKRKGYIFGADHYRKSNYIYTDPQTESIRKRILAGQAGLERNMEHYFGEDAVI